MTAIAPAPPVAAARPRLGRGYQFEVAKLLSHWRTRALVLAAWLLPAIFVIVVSQQTSLPTDTPFGRWMAISGWAGTLVTLAFSGTWAFPLFAALLAGDVFSVEDRLGTWQHLMIAVRSPRRLFVAKAAASATVIGIVVVGLAVSSIVGGLIGAGADPLIGIDGHTMDSGSAATAVAFAWLGSLPAVAAFAAIGLLGSVLFRRSPIGLLLPALLALGFQLAQLLPLPVAVRLALPGYGFAAWSGLFAEPVEVTGLVISLVVNLAWAVAITVAAYLLFVRRDFSSHSSDTAGNRAIGAGIATIVAVAVLGVVALIPVTAGAGSGITADKLQRTLATEFGHLYRLQTDALHRPAVTEDQLGATAACTKADGTLEQTGPGNDWRCTVSWHLPAVAGSVGQAVYQLDVLPDGSFIADGDGPRDVNGYYLIPGTSSDVPNPLWQFDGIVDLLPAGT